MGTKSKILVVDDEAAIRSMVQFALSHTGFETELAVDAQQALEKITDSPPQLILLDWMLPDTSGVELARRLRGQATTASIPIIMLTARGEEHDKVQGLEAGADDYITKPFSPRELIARINAVLRRSENESLNETLEVGGLRIDTASHRVTADGVEVNLGPKEYQLLHFFMSHQERVFSRAQLLDHVWGQNVYIEDRTVDVHIRRLRKSLAVTGAEKMIQTVRGAGYRFSKQESN